MHECDTKDFRSRRKDSFTSEFFRDDVHRLISFNFHCLLTISSVLVTSDVKALPTARMYQAFETLSQETQPEHMPPGPSFQVEDDIDLSQIFLWRACYEVLYSVCNMKASSEAF
jgi:hypothetical protein